MRTVVEMERRERSVLHAPAAVELAIFAAHIRPAFRNLAVTMPVIDP